jgi:hypothetical protein
MQTNRLNRRALCGRPPHGQQVWLSVREASARNGRFNAAIDAAWRRAAA